MTVYIVQYVCSYDRTAEIIAVHRSKEGAEASQDAAKHRGGCGYIDIVELDLED